MHYKNLNSYFCGNQVLHNKDQRRAENLTHRKKWGCADKIKICIVADIPIYFVMIISKS